MTCRYLFSKVVSSWSNIDRRSGFLVPTLYDSKNLGSGISIYFFDFGKWNKNYVNKQNLCLWKSLILGEYHQAFKQSNLLADFGFTEGYKKTSSTKKVEKNHIFLQKFVKTLNQMTMIKNFLEINFQNVSDDKYLKLYKVDSNLLILILKI